MDQDFNQSQATPKQQVVERVRAATNVLVTVRSNPTVDELTAAIGLTLMLNKLGKHATAVFSGKVPSTLEFLKPDETIETNTDSLRDFIVSLDKSKADKLRYKVEENVVKIFITPYRTSITQNDLEFTQGDFNVDVVLALGVTQREELDQAVIAHGRILHDATVITITAGQHESTLGMINWQEAGASSLSEMLVSVSEAFQGGIIDAQMATAFLTGIVAETERFSNTKTSPKVMTMAAQLMAAGANQQLIANELQKVEELPMDQPVDVSHEEAVAPEARVDDDGSLTIAHNGNEDNIRREKESKNPEKAQEKSAEPMFEAQQPANGLVNFLPPLPEQGGDNSFEPLLTTNIPSNPMPSQPEPPESDEPVDIFASLGGAEPADESLPKLTPEPEPSPEPTPDENQIHIDDHGNLLKSERPTQPKHKSVEPLHDAPDQSKTAYGMDDQLADIAAMFTDNSSSSAPVRQPVQRDESIQYAPDPIVISPQPPEDKNNDAPALPSLDLPPLPPVGESPQSEQVHVSEPTPEPVPVAPAVPIPDPASTIEDIEKTVGSPHIGLTGDPAIDEAKVVDDARDAVMSAINQAGYDADRPEPRVDINAQPLSPPPASAEPAVPSFEMPHPALNGFDPSAPQPVPDAPGLATQVPGGMPLHTLGEVIPEGSNHNDVLPPPPPIPPPMMPSSFPPQ